MSKTRIDRDAILNASRAMATKTKPAPTPSRQPTAAANPDRTDFKRLDLYEQIRIQREAAKTLGVTNPYFIEHQGRASATTRIDGKTVLNFASYDYLGLNGLPEIQDAAIDAIGTYGTSVSGSRPTSGERPFHRELEADLARLYESEAALVFVSGHATNVSTIGELLGSADLVIYDGFSHNSVVTGCKLSGAARKTFKHNDFDDLERILSEQRNQYDHVLIIVEGLYSMDGDLPDLARAIELKERYQAWLMVDEAHSLGVLGKTGKGLFEQQSIDPRKVDIWMGTMSKTLSGCGGYICGKQELIDILKFFASSFMYSVGLSAPLAVAAKASLQVMQQEPWRVEKLQSNGRYFLDHAKQAGLDTGLSAGFCVVPVIVGDSLRAVKLANNLLERGVYAFPITHPAVPMNEARLRFFITAEHSEEQLQQAIDITAEELRKLEAEGFSLLSSLAGQIEAG
ncbi:aminotransferase class I/II-fold pyridoxal phosphate-dependent enzyme [Cohaesibacter sp. CAU 1516]|uniref:aminotransferase class I/II-fold pyridoxal phosphate-dependent enzyme n=1 Tax=Cohaesibacter sp. CAU 1516 TaxID=2576038 RepID=UPI0010FE6948|nr:aminotransferase class I/II-fold pyridoxal phosphate-dependent enzyme [Cohaesibacter sp. CAU 1516]TLP42391.1 aminotransferase class I/II-fold pyridoxal phosphate-dependent enzyme [Cohaesibacter sp. CAU 1516]